jgi:hypothetical protein
MMTANKLTTIAVATALVLLSSSCGDDTPDQETSGSTTSVISITSTTASTSTPSTTSTTPTTSTAASSSTTSAPAPSTTVPGTAPVDSAVECSAAGLVAPPIPSELDPTAAVTFGAIVDAAVACDFDALALVAGDAITLSFGGHGDVADFLATAEFEVGDPLLRILVQLLAMPPGYQEDFATWVWPTFWEDDEPATAEERTAIEEIYGRPFDEILVDDLGYINHRVGIDANGEWLFFVAGD